MVPVDLRSLVAKLSDHGRRALEAAAGLTLSRSHYTVEIEHWLIKLLDDPRSDIVACLKQYEVDPARVVADLTRVLDRLKTGNARAPGLSPNLVSLAREAWMLASLHYGAPRIRSGHVLVALLADETLSLVAREASGQFGRLPADALKRDLPKLTSDSSEAADSAAAAAAEGATGGGAGAAPQARPGTAALDQFTIDLTQRAKDGKIDPVVGREAEIRQVVDILTRRRQNNPILTGEAGVGKTSVVEGFALKIVSGDVPPALRNVTLRTLDLGLLQAGAGIKGEFENRLKSVIEEVKSSPKPVILFIDEAHNLVGAGGQAGQGDAANLMKPALARGELRTIAATTWAEYKKYFERDAALTRRFQVVKVEEPDEASAVEMMRGVLATLEKHHNVRILNEAVVEAVRLSHRYIPARQLPDKAISLLDTACARVGMSQAATPAALEDVLRRIDQVKITVGILEREAATGGDHAKRLTECTEQLASLEAERAKLDARWQEEKAVISQIRELRDWLEEAQGVAPKKDGKDGKGAKAGGDAMPAAPAKPEDIAAKKAELAALDKKLDEIQGETPLLQVNVDGQTIAAVVAAWTGIPVGRMVSDEIKSVLNLRERMEERIIGQSHALEVIAQAMRTNRAKLTDPRKPVGVFLMVGTSGVGKTETALALADLLYGGEQNLTTIAMSEFKEEHKVSLLMGSPPGYVGYGEGGVLTEAVRRKPYSVVLLDELEKAHPGVHDIFFQVFDKGNLRDGEGRDIDFKNTLIIMTSNVGTDTIAKLCADPETKPEPEALYEALRPDLLKVFKPAFLGRLAVVPYYPLGEDIIRRIIKLQLDRVGKRVQENYQASFSFGQDVIDSIAARCHESESGARNIEHILTRTMLPEMAGVFLSRMAEGQPITAVTVVMDGDGRFRYDVT